MASNTNVNFFPLGGDLYVETKLWRKELRINITQFKPSLAINDNKDLLTKKAVPIKEEQLDQLITSYEKIKDEIAALRERTRATPPAPAPSPLTPPIGGGFYTPQKLS